MDITIIIPAFNERAKIVRDIEAAHAFLQGASFQGEILIVADGSTDDTVDFAENCRPSIPEVRVLEYSRQRGKGFAIKRGVAEAKGRIIMFADSGLCVPYEDAIQGLELLQSGRCELAHGSRSAAGTVLVKRQPLFRRLGSKYFRIFIHNMMGIPRSIRDTQCGFKLYRADVARELYADLFTPGYMFDVEIILRALRRGYRIVDFPVRWTNDEDTRLDPVRGTVDIIRSLANIRARVSFERRPRARSERAIESEERA